MKPAAQKTPATHSCGLRAFTLVELLTVIAIIGVLAAIMIPTLGAVRKKARGVQCVSNLRALFNAASLCANDTGYYPSFNRDRMVNYHDGYEHDGRDKPWFVSLINRKYLDSYLKTVAGSEIRWSDALISPLEENSESSEDGNEIGRKSWAADVVTPSYATNPYWGVDYYDAGPVSPSQISNARAIYLVKTKNSNFYADNPAQVKWDSSSTRLSSGANAVTAGGSVISLNPNTHPKIEEEHYWNPRL